MFGAVMPLIMTQIKTLTEQISLATSQDTVVCHFYWRRNTFPPSNNWTFCFCPDISYL